MRKYIQRLFLTLSVALCTVGSAYAHGAWLDIPTIRYSAATEAQIQANIDAGNSPIMPGDIVEVISEFGVITDGTLSGPNGYFTFYIPNGTTVVGASYVDASESDIPVRTATSAVSGEGISKGWGPRGEQSFDVTANGWNPSPLPTLCTANGLTAENCNAGLAYIYGDTGIFYSTDPDTALYTGDGTEVANLTNGYRINPTNGAPWPSIGGTGDARIHNKWDAVQSNAFGSTSALANPGFSALENTSIADGRGTTPFRTGSVVAGPDSGSPLDRYGTVGPWNRISYSGSCLAGLPSDGPANSAGAIYPETPTGANSVEVCVPTSSGVLLSESSPLPSGTTAVRWATGGVTAGETHYIKIRLSVSDPTLIKSYNAEATGGDSTEGAANGNDNPWRYYVGGAGTPAPGFANRMAISKSIVQVNGSPYTAGAPIPVDATVRYRIGYGNTGLADQTNVVISDILPPETVSTANFTIISGPDIRPGSNPSGGTFNFLTIPTLTTGAGGGIEFDVVTDSIVDDVVTNTAEVVSNEITTPITSSASAVVIYDGPADQSDAPLTGTNYDNAVHAIVSGVQLGAGVTAESAPYDSPNADGDVDDGITFPALTHGLSATLSAEVSGSGGFLQGWIDWNDDGDWDDFDEQIASDLQDGDSDGQISIPVSIPYSGTSTSTIARFRWSQTAALNSTQFADAGEVEDYLVNITSDPNVTPTCPAGFTYSMTSGNAASVTDHSGASDTGRALGAIAAAGTSPADPISSLLNNTGEYLTVELGHLMPDGAQLILSLARGAGANGDNALAEIFVSADNVNYTSMGTYGAGGDFPSAVQDTTEQIAFSVPNTGAKFVRFDNLNADEILIDGAEYSDACIPDGIEDHSDAPLTGTNYGNAIHTYDAQYYMGYGVSPENAPYDSPNADGDVDDGVTLPPLQQDQVSFIPVDVTGVAGKLQAWADWNGDGDWDDAGEQLIVDYEDLDNDGTINVPITVPENASTFQTFMRYRWSTTGGADTTETVNEGEVEDYAITFSPAGTTGALSCPASYVAAAGSGNATTVLTDPGNGNLATGPIAGQGTDADGVSTIIEDGTTALTLQLGDIVPGGALLTISIAVKEGDAISEIETSYQGSTYTSVAYYTSDVKDDLNHLYIVVPSGGMDHIRFTGIDKKTWIDGVEYSDICQSSPPPDLSAAKTITVFDPANEGLYALPGNDVIYTITVTNSGAGTTDDDSFFLVDLIPAEVSIWVGDIDDGGPDTYPGTDPVGFQQSTGAGLTFNYSTDVGFSTDTAAPSDFTECSPLAADDAYHPEITHICFAPKGKLNAGTPDPNFSVSFRSQIK
ncbi:MAG: hypothetical protein HKN36_06550 [Hellea sp.]|nr:hypothetical protein [Hellea sp.]